MATAGSIVIDLLMKTGSFETDTKRAEKALQELQKEARAMGVAVGAAFTAVAAASVALVKSAIDTADEMGKMAQKVGTSVEALSALAYAADLAGIEHDQLSAAMVKLSKNMSDAAEGTGDAAKAFEALGINVQRADGSLKSSDEVLTEVAEKFAGYRDGVEKTALAVAIFGKAGADMIPLLNSGAAGLAQATEEARVLGAVLDDETSKAAETFNDNLTRMGYAVKGVANQAAKELLPTLNAVAQMFLDVATNQTAASVATDIVKAAVGGLVTVFQTIAVVGSDVGFVFLSVGREIGAWAAQLAAIARGDWQGFRAISDAVKEDGERARAELDKFQAKVMNMGLGGGMDDEARRRAGHGVPLARPAAPRLPGGAPKTPKPPTEKQFKTSDRWDEASALQAEQDMLNEAVEIYAKSLNVVQEKTKETKSLAEELGLTFASAFEDAVIGGNSLREVFTGLLKDIARLILRMEVTEPLMAAFKGAVGGSDSGVGSFFGDLFKSAVGSFFGGAKAPGGDVIGGREYLVGEHGPEMFVPRTAGAIAPANAAGGTGAISIINQTSGRIDSVATQRVSASERALILQENRAAILGEMYDPGSKMSRALGVNFNVKRAR